MKMNVRAYAVDSLLKIEREGAFSNLEIRDTLSRFSFSSEDRRLYTNIVYGTLQNKIYLDWLISQVVMPSQNRLDEIVTVILQTAVYQIFFLDRIPNYAIVDESVKLTREKKKKAVGFVNGVLRSVLRRKDELSDYDFNAWQNEKEALSVRYSVPQWIVHKYFETFGDEIGESLIKKVNHIPPFTIRVNTLKTNREHLCHLLEKDGISCRYGELSENAVHLDFNHSDNHDIRRNEWFQKGYFTVQDQGAMVLTELLDPQPGERILDMCAAPGGKTTYIAQLMKNTGEITARDINDSRIELIENAAKRLGITIIETERFDGSCLNPIDIQTYDRILLDAPCSGMGVIRRKPEIRYLSDKKERKALRSIQSDMLDHAADMLKVGGVLIYSTCTILPEENEKQIEAFLERHPEMESIPDKTGYTHFNMDGADCFFYCQCKKKSTRY